MEMEIEELRRQRDLAKSQVDELRKKIEVDQQVSLSLSVTCLHMKYMISSTYYISKSAMEVPQHKLSK